MHCKGYTYTSKGSQLAGNNYYYLNDDGYLASDELVEYEDNYYYVDETGAMVRNAWKEVDNTDDDEDFEDTVWYYFQSSGKAYENTKKSINGQTYIFNEDGKMLFGWINDKPTGGDYEMADKDEDSDGWKNAVYYAGEANDGAVVTSAWRQIRVNDDQPALKADDAETGDFDYWFYFDSNGKKVYAKDDNSDPDVDGLKTKTIGGKKYGFTAWGNMVSEWVDERATAAEGKYGKVAYFSDPEVGARVSKGWFKVVPSEAIDGEDYEGGNDDAHWFYAESNGDLVYNKVKSINGKKYLFADNGELKAGLRWLTFDDEGNLNEEIGIDLTGDDGTKELLDKFTAVDNEMEQSNSKDGLYYFAKPIDDDATMKTGSCTITIDGDSYSFKFDSGTNKGQGITKLDGNYYYVNGRKITADSDAKFELYYCTTANKKVTGLYGQTWTADELVRGVTDGIYSYDGGAVDGFAVVSTSGSIIKSGTKKDGDSYKITVKDSVVTQIKDSDDNVWLFKTSEDGDVVVTRDYDVD